MSGQQHAPGAPYPRERPGTHCTGDWVGPRAGLDGRNISPPPGFDPRTVQPLVSCYIDWATRPNSYNKTIKYTNVKIVFLHTICHNYVSIYPEHPVTEYRYSIYKDINGFSNTLKFVHKVCADIIKFVCTSSTLLQTHFTISAHILCTNVNLIIYVFIYALFMLSNSLRMIKIYRNMSQLWETVCKKYDLHISVIVRLVVWNAIAINRNDVIFKSLQSIITKWLAREIPRSFWISQ